MKTIFILGLMIISSLAMAVTTPIKNDVVLKNTMFAAKIYKALSKKVKPVKVEQNGVTLNRIMIPALITCYQHNNSLATCTLIKGAWKDLGSSVYSVIRDENVAKLYDSLSIKAQTEPGTDMTTKSIELEVDDEEGGTERNLLACTKMGELEIEMGLRSTCQLINAL